MPPQYERERSENEVFSEDAGPPSPAPVTEIRPHYQGIDPQATLGPNRQPDYPAEAFNAEAARAQAEARAKTIQRIRELENERDELATRTQQRFEGVSQKFNLCLERLDQARTTNDYVSESQLAKRAGELQSNLQMAEKIRDNNLERIDKINAELASLRLSLEQPEPAALPRPEPDQLLAA